MSVIPNAEPDPYSEEGLEPYPEVDPYAKAEEEAAAAAAAEEDERAIEADHQNAQADLTRGGGPQQIGDILRPVVDNILHRNREDTTGD